MMYKAWLYIQLGFWLLIAKLERPYIRWKVKRDIKSLEKKGLVVTHGRGKDMTYDLTPLGRAVVKLIVHPGDIRG